MIYVDLERDVFLTISRWGRIMVSRRNRPKDPPEFAQWPVRHGDFLIDVFQAVVPRSILARMRIFVAKFSLFPKELFSVRPGERGVGIRMASTHRVLVLNWPFDGDGGREDFVEQLRFLRKPGVQMGGRIRLLKDILELERVVRGGSLTPWAERRDLGEWSMGGYFKEE